MIEWKLGIGSDFSLSIGKNGKFLKRYISKQIWERLLKAYPSGDYESVWPALYIMTDLFEEIAMEVAFHFDYSYPRTYWTTPLYMELNRTTTQYHDWEHIIIT